MVKKSKREIINQLTDLRDKIHTESDNMRILQKNLQELNDNLDGLERDIHNIINELEK